MEIKLGFKTAFIVGLAWELGRLLARRVDIFITCVLRRCLYNTNLGKKSIKWCGYGDYEEPESEQKNTVKMGFH